MKRGMMSSYPKPITVKLVIDLALALGKWIREQNPTNPAIAALGHTLDHLEPEESEDQPARKMRKPIESNQWAFCVR